MKKKLGLNQLKIESFVTEVIQKKENTIKGGGPDYITRLIDNCIQDSEWSYCECNDNHTKTAQCVTAATCAGWACLSNSPCSWA